MDGKGIVIQRDKWFGMTGSWPLLEGQYESQGTLVSEGPVSRLGGLDCASQISY